jgi:hypothetical protein
MTLTKITTILTSSTQNQRKTNKQKVSGGELRYEFRVCCWWRMWWVRLWWNWVLKGTWNLWKGESLLVEHVYSIVGGKVSFGFWNLGEIESGGLWGELGEIWEKQVVQHNCRLFVEIHKVSKTLGGNKFSNCCWIHLMIIRIYPKMQRSTTIKSKTKLQNEFVLKNDVDPIEDVVKATMTC